MDVHEEWRPVVGWEGHYEVSNLGSVRGLDTTASGGNGAIRLVRGKVMRPQNNNCGYKHVALSRVKANRKNATRLVHHLVAEAFLGPRPPGYQVNHIDGDKENNTVANLEYLTASDNVKHAYRIGRHQRTGFPGESHPQSKLTERDVRSIFERRLAGELYTEIAKSLGVTPNSVRGICIGRTWRHLGLTSRKEATDGAQEGCVCLPAGT